MFHELTNVQRTVSRDHDYNECYFTEKAVRQNAVNTTDNKIKWTIENKCTTTTTTKNHWLIDWLIVNGTSTQKGQFVPTVAQAAKDGQRDTILEKVRNFGDLCFISWLIFRQNTLYSSARECYFILLRNAVNTTESKTVKWKQMHHNNYYLNLIGKRSNFGDLCFRD